MADIRFSLTPLDATFGAVVQGVDLRDLDEATWVALHEAWLEYALLIFPGQFLTREEQDAFARRFGDLEFPAAPISNLDREGALHRDLGDDIVRSLRGNEGWHHDSTYMPVQAKGAVFCAEIVPAEGGGTGWADMRAAYDALDAETRQAIAGLSAYPLAALQPGPGRALAARPGPMPATTWATATTRAKRRCARWSRSIPTPGGPTW